MNTQLNILQTAIWTILFVAPGYIASKAKHYWMMTTPRRPSDITIECIYWSFLIYFLLSIMPSFVFDLARFVDFLTILNTPEKILFDSKFIQSYIFVILTAAISGFMYGHFFPVALMSTILGRTPHARVWDEFWKLRSVEAANHGVWLELKDGTQWIGKLNSASDTAGSSEIWLSDVRRYFQEHSYISDTPYSDMLINAEKIERVFIVKKGVLTQSIYSPPKNIFEKIKKQFTWNKKVKQQATVTITDKNV